MPLEGLSIMSESDEILYLVNANTVQVLYMSVFFKNICNSVANVKYRRSRDLRLDPLGRRCRRHRPACRECLHTHHSLRIN